MNRNLIPADEHWRKLLKNSHFTTHVDLPHDPRKRQALAVDADSARKHEEFLKKWEGTTPQGREIIRKKLHAFKKKLALQNPSAQVGF